MDIFKTIKEIFDPNADQPKNKNQKNPAHPKTSKPKDNKQNTLGHAPAQHPITEEELKKLVEAASDPAVQDVIKDELVPVFHPESNRQDTKKSVFLRNK